MSAPLTPLCAPALAERLREPQGLAAEVLLRSYRADEWDLWFAAAGATCPAVRGPMYDTSLALAAVAVQGAGVALLPVAMFERELIEGRLVRPFAAEVETGAYWLTRLKTRRPSPAMAAFRDWLVGEAHAVEGGSPP